jgi:hypothetical protein
MDYGSAQLGATSRANAAANKPLLVGAHSLRDVPSSVQWRTSGSWAAGSDGTDTTNGPASYLWDGFVDLRSKPSSAQATWYLIINHSATLTAFDCIFIISHNLGTLGGVTVTYEVADDNAYTSNLVQVASWAVTTSTKRLVALKLDHTGAGIARQYTSVQYSRLKIVAAGAVTPEIGELILGTRRQLTRKPNREFDPDHLRSYASKFRGGTRKVTSYVEAQGQKILNARFEPDDSTEQNDIRAFWQSDLDMGSHPFVWVPDPESYPEKAYVMDAPLDFALPDFSVGQVRWDLVSEEQGDQFVALET